MAPALTKIAKNAQGVHLSSPNHHGLLLSSNHNGVHLSSPNDHGVPLSSSNHNEVHLSSPNDHGVPLSSSNHKGVHLSSPNHHGVHLSSSNHNGVHQSSPNHHGVHLSSPNDHGVPLSSPNGHGVHLSSHLAPAEAEGRDILDIELDLQSTMAEDDYPQKLWLSPSFLPFLHSCLPGGLLEFSDNADLPPFQHQSSTDQAKPTFLPSPCSLFNILSSQKSPRDPQQLATDLQPGTMDTLFISVDGGERQESSLQPHSHGGALHNYEPDVFETHRTRTPSPEEGLTLGLRSSGPEWAQHCSVVLGPPVILEKTAGIQQKHLAVRRERCWSKLVRQIDLEGRALWLQMRPQALPMSHASQRLPGLKHQETSDAPFSAAVEPCEMAMCNKATLQGIGPEFSLDSEATDSSSSSDDDDDRDVDEGRPRLQRKRRRDNQKILPGSPTSNELRWLGDRAEMGSRWSWLVLRLAELEGRIQHLVELLKHFHSTKVGVVLGDSQSLTDQQQIQQTLLKETLGLSCTARVRGGELPWDADYEHSSPTCLLRNIERQSAQLSQIVTSLSPCSSPHSKAPHTLMGVTKTAYSPQGAENKRRRLSIQGRHRALRRPLKGFCARTRPLLTYHKHRLFTMEEAGPGALQAGQSTSPPSSSSWEPVAQCAVPSGPLSISPGGSLTCGATHSKPPPPSCSSDSPCCSHFQRTPSGERWSQRPIEVDVAEPCDPSLSWDGLHRSGEEGLSDLLCDHHEISELLEETYTEYQKHTRMLASRGPVHRRKGETLYGLDNIIIPMSLAPGAKVEAKQYKHILTPSWRLVSMQTSQEMRGEEEGDEVEGMTEEVFLQRHLEPERREMLRWSSWGRRRCRHRSTRPSGGEGPCSLGEEESSMESSPALLEMDEHSGMEDKRMPASPWEPRSFPLTEAAEEKALPSVDAKESTVLRRSLPFSILSSYGASSVPSVGKNRNSMVPLCSC
ncbi:KAT8 regulatory NSL complex subunit 1-like protein isoform X2 [Gadus morhua]|uniref:KAT8 regulatory NSL complex subunit 1-like protein isoform X2 n=1 Tax=Gadus morhua TaxID=8049 RepID=UPI0011B7C039|nr:KAT8 regulatory NSL complex subunit 1-like protein isoform X2 [Gadus morhua]